MKKMFPLFAFILCVNMSMAQITLDQNNFLRPPNYVDSFTRASNVGVMIPTSGALQSWDYSTLTATSTGVSTYMDATMDTNFVTATNKYTYNLSFQGMIIPGTRYESIDMNGWYVMGRTSVDTIYDLAAITGNSADSLRFPPMVDHHVGRANVIDFPSTYQSQWVQSYTEYVDYELTVAAFGLNKTPGKRKRDVTYDRNVIGYGQLTIPDALGNPSVSFGALLIESNTIVVDSFFLNGSPAPAPLMAAFGLSQGDTAKTKTYLFYRDYLGTPALIVSVDASGQVSSAAYRPHAALITSIDEIDTPLDFVSTYPNPIKKGEELVISTEKIEQVSNVKILGMNGQCLYLAPVLSSGNSLSINLPENITAGVYFVQLENEKGTTIGVSKLVVAQ